MRTYEVNSRQHKAWIYDEQLKLKPNQFEFQTSWQTTRKSPVPGIAITDAGTLTPLPDSPLKPLLPNSL